MFNFLKNLYSTSNVINVKEFFTSLFLIFELNDALQGLELESPPHVLQT